MFFYLSEDENNVCLGITNLVIVGLFDQATLRESWLDDMMHVLEEEQLAQDAATVEAAIKRHEAISTDVKARVSGRSFFVLDALVN